MKIKLTLDKRQVEYDAHPGEILIECLRRHGCFSVKRGCQDGNCGTCLVQINGQVVNSCLMLAAQADGAQITTAAGVGNLDNPHPIQTAFVENAATQCGFCTPGLVVSVKALLERVPNPNEAEIKEAIDGNICRCTGYTKIFDAIQDAIKTTQEAA